MHSKRLDISFAAMKFSQFALPVEALEIIPVPEKEAIGFRFANPITEGTRAWLSIKFKGVISSNLEGIFSTPYVDAKGEKHLGASTMFAATEARTCFPCFDEPEFKAVFALEITVDSHLMVISNMPVMDSVSKSNGKKRTDHFEWTREMSSYLVCFVIGIYEYLETKAAGTTLVRVFTPCGQRIQGLFALEVAKKSLEFFNNYFGKVYPLPKLDLVALSRLSVGAMENWGIITCRETGMITDEKAANPSTLQRIATLIAHEISHQWFGNLVTMKWWDGLYLNEAFATLMQFICIDHIYPKFQVFNQFCAENVIPALGLDALQNSHPIEMELRDSSEINQLFDKITYCKGASVMFMLHEFIGAKAFRSAIQEYMQHFSYDNATTEDLWDFLSSTSQKDIGAIMNSWIRELGFPVVCASHFFNEDSQFVLSLRQERFSNRGPGTRHMLWNIPLKGIYTRQAGDGNNSGTKVETFDTLFDKETLDIPIVGMSMNDPKSWLKINPRLTGFYRVQYSEELFDKLLANMDNENLSAIDRMGLFDDQVAMVLSAGGCTMRILKMVELFKDFEMSVTVWKNVSGILHQIHTLTWPTEDTANLMNQFCLEMYKPVLSKIGFQPRPDESYSDTMLRCTLFPILAILGDEEVQAAAKEMFKNHVDGTVVIQSGFRDSVFRSVMVTANQQTYEQMLMLYREAEFAEDRVVILGSLGCAQDRNILTQCLEFSLSPEVHAQESLSVLVSASSNRFGYKLVWQFFTRNFQKILDRYLGGLFIFTKMLKSVTGTFCSNEGYEEIAEFLATHKHRMVGSEHAAQQAEEHIRLNIIWRDKDVGKIQTFMDRYFNS